MEQDDDNLKQQKVKRALERKRASDRNARRVERARTKEHIANLEERVRLLLQRDDNSDFVQKILVENQQLTKRIHAYQNIVQSARTVLQDIPEASALTPVSGTTPDDGKSKGDHIRFIDSPGH
jgi:hypothetical protein